MQDRPTAAELLEAIAELLEKQVLPAIQGPLQHQVRVAGNLARILEREARLLPELDASEASLLRGVLGEEDDDRDLADLSRALVRKLDSEDVDAVLERKSHAALLEIVRGKLSIDKPGYDTYDFAEELDA